MAISPVVVDKPHVRQCYTEPCVPVTPTHRLNCFLSPDIMGCDRVTEQSVCIYAHKTLEEMEISPESSPGRDLFADVKQPLLRLKLLPKRSQSLKAGPQSMAPETGGWGEVGGQRLGDP